MRSAVPLSAALFAAATAFAAPASAAIVLNVDKSSQQMTVSVDGAQRYVWPVSTGRAGYDTPNGTFKVNRMDADHLSQEWDNAPMPHTMFFDMRGHAIHGFFDVKHLGLPVSHGCVRLSPTNAATLYALVEGEGMKETTVIVSGQTPAYNSQLIARQRAPVQPQDVSASPMQLAPDYGQQQQPGYGAPQPIPPGYGAQPGDGQAYYQQQPNYRTQPPPGYGQAQQPYYAQTPQPYYGQPAQPAYVRQPAYAQQPPTYAQQPQAPAGYYAQQPAYPPPQPPPVFGVRPFGQF